MFKKKSNLLYALLATSAFMVGTSCKKGTFDINSTNPNSPTNVSPSFSLPAAEAATARLMLGGNASILNTWMGYWSVSGDYTASPTIVLYQLNSGTSSGNWDDAYLNLANYNLIEKEAAADPTLSNYGAIAIIMKAFVYQRLVDLYNNVPYANALSGSNFTPAYSSGLNIYISGFSRLDSAIGVIKKASASAVNPGKFDVMYQGSMSKWIKFANTLKLKMALRLTQSTSASVGTAAVAGLTSADFIGVGDSATINPGYSTAADNQENPQYLDIGYTISGSLGTFNAYWRANSYAVNFYTTNNDPRKYYFYEVKSDGSVNGRVFGSTALEHNDAISGVFGKGVIKSASQGASILPTSESFFLQAEAQQRGMIAGTAQTSYQNAITQSFVYLGANYPADTVTYTPTTSAAKYYSQGNSTVNWATTGDKITKIITQKWAALNNIDPLESFSDWRRLGIPADLPVSAYPGNTATHIPYRLEYATTEQSYNTANVKSQGTVDIFTSKIFWMP